MATNDQPPPNKRPTRRRRAATVEASANIAETTGPDADRAPGADKAGSSIPVSVAGKESPAASSGAGSEPPTPPRASTRGPSQRSGGILAMLAGAIMGALVVAIVAYLLIFTDVLPAPGGEAAEEALAEAQRIGAELDGLRQAIADVPAPDFTPLQQRIDALEGALAALPDLQAGVEAAAAATQAAADERNAIADDLAALQQEVVAAAAAAGDPAAAARLGDNIAAIGERLAVLEAAGPGPEITALEQAIATLQTDIAALTTATETLAANAEVRDRTADAARVLAVNNLRFAAERGDPFTAELAVLTELGVAPETLAALTPIAQTGAESRSELADAFSEVAFAILEATNAVEPEAGFWERLFGNARNVVTVRPTTPIEGDTPGAIVSRMQAAVDAGDLATALAERETLPSNGLAASSDWAERVRARIDLDIALTELAAAIQQQIGE